MSRYVDIRRIKLNREQFRKPGALKVKPPVYRFRSKTRAPERPVVVITSERHRRTFVHLASKVVKETNPSPKKTVEIIQSWERSLSHKIVLQRARFTEFIILLTLRTGEISSRFEGSPQQFTQYFLD